MTIFHPAIADVLATDLPFMQDVLHGLGRSYPALIKSIQTKLTARRFHLGDLFDAKVLWMAF
jgi:hypothetical protein